MSNFFICRNRVEVEGVDIGQFEGFTLDSDWRTFGVTAVLTLPMYAIGATGSTTGKAAARFRSETIRDYIKVCAEIDVYCWYEGMEEQHVFHGYIEKVDWGFPSKLYLRDGSFILRFGATKGLNGNIKLDQVARDCVNVANEAFTSARREAGLTRNTLPLTYSLNDENVQAISSPIPFDNFANGRSPYEILQYLIREIRCIGGVSRSNKLYIGLGVQDSKRGTVHLRTDLNVIQRDIEKINGAFVDYDVQVSYVDKDGKMYTVSAESNQKVVTEHRGKLQKGLGEQYLAFAPFDNQDDAKTFADTLLKNLRGENNKGSITTLLFPKMQLFDHVIYDDTVFDQYDHQYYVIGYKLTANLKGYFQQITVTNKVFAL